MKNHESDSAFLEDVESALADYRTLRADGKAPPVDEFCRRYGSVGPALRERIDDYLFVVSGLEDVVPVGLSSTDVTDPPHPTRIGPYDVIEVLGEGGMGIVYLAKQSAPVQRRVAIKLVKSGMDSRNVLARFESERQALAIMEHSCVARVFDAGTSGDGLPYFVMEYFQGVSITRYCEEKQLSTNERIELLRQVCAGVQHAHQKGVIHRDLKPSNVLVVEEDGQPLPKIIDFGLARATEERLDDQTLLTHSGQMLGTPEYMSPEQARGEGVDTRTDVYSLGVILYELLTGRLPLEGPELRSTSLAGMQRIICEREPGKLSSRFASVHPPGLPWIAQSTPARRLRGDLDCIAMKALEKDPEQRYTSAGAMADDLGRMLAHEAVLARPPSVLYRVRRFGRKHSGMLAAGAAAATILLLFAHSLVQRSLEESERAFRPHAEALAEARRAILQESDLEVPLAGLIQGVSALPDGRWDVDRQGAILDVVEHLRVKGLPVAARALLQTMVRRPVDSSLRVRFEIERARAAFHGLRFAEATRHLDAALEREHHRGREAELESYRGIARRLRNVVEFQKWCEPAQMVACADPKRPGRDALLIVRRRNGRLSFDLWNVATKQPVEVAATNTPEKGLWHKSYWVGTYGKGPQQWLFLAAPTIWPPKSPYQSVVAAWQFKRSGAELRCRCSVLVDEGVYKVVGAQLDTDDAPEAIVLGGLSHRQAIVIDDLSSRKKLGPFYMNPENKDEDISGALVRTGTGATPEVILTTQGHRRFGLFRYRLDRGRFRRVVEGRRGADLCSGSVFATGQLQDGRLLLGRCFTPTGQHFQVHRDFDRTRSGLYSVKLDHDEWRVEKWWDLDHLAWWSVLEELHVDLTEEWTLTRLHFESKATLPRSARDAATQWLVAPIGPILHLGPWSLPGFRRALLADLDGDRDSEVVFLHKDRTSIAGLRDSPAMSGRSGRTPPPVEQDDAVACVVVRALAARVGTSDALLTHATQRLVEAGRFDLARRVVEEWREAQRAARHQHAAALLADLGVLEGEYRLPDAGTYDTGPLLRLRGASLTVDLARLGKLRPLGRPLSPLGLTPSRLEVTTLRDDVGRLGGWYSGQAITRFTHSGRENPDHIDTREVLYEPAELWRGTHGIRLRFHLFVERMPYGGGFFVGIVDNKGTTVVNIGFSHSRNGRAFQGDRYIANLVTPAKNEDQFSQPVGLRCTEFPIGQWLRVEYDCVWELGVAHLRIDYANRRGRGSAIARLHRTLIKTARRPRGNLRLRVASSVSFETEELNAVKVSACLADIELGR